MSNASTSEAVNDSFEPSRNSARGSEVRHRAFASSLKGCTPTLILLQSKRRGLELIDSAERGDSETVQRLLDAGADVNAKDVWLLMQ